MSKEFSALNAKNLSLSQEMLQVNDKLNTYLHDDIIAREHFSLTEISDVLFVIPCCNKNHHKHQRISGSWGKEVKRLGGSIIYIFGSPELSTPQLKGDILQVPCEDNYESLLLKLALAYKYADENKTFKYLYKIDDDCFPNLQQLAQIIIPRLASFPYVGGQVHPKDKLLNNQWHIGKCNHEKFNQPTPFISAPVSFAKGGYSYFLRKDVLKIIYKKIPDFKKELDDGEYSPEDLRIALLLHEEIIFPIAIDRFKAVNSTLMNKTNINEKINTDLYYNIESDVSFKKIAEKIYPPENIKGK